MTRQVLGRFYDKKYLLPKYVLKLGKHMNHNSYELESVQRSRSN